MEIIHGEAWFVIKQMIPINSTLGSQLCGDMRFHPLFQILISSIISNFDFIHYFKFWFHCLNHLLYEGDHVWISYFVITLKIIWFVTKIITCLLYIFDTTQRNIYIEKIFHLYSYLTNSSFGKWILHNAHNNVLILFYNRHLYFLAVY